MSKALPARPSVQRPTPETDAVNASYRYGDASEMVNSLIEHGGRLERQREELAEALQELLSAWRMQMSSYGTADVQKNAEAALASLEAK